jgi:hypothetical protein
MYADRLATNLERPLTVRGDEKPHLLTQLEKKSILVNFMKAARILGKPVEMGSLQEGLAKLLQTLSGS